MNKGMKKVMRKIQNIKSIFALLACIVLSVLGFTGCDWSFLNGGVATFASLDAEEDDVFNERQIPQEEFFYVKVEDARSARRGDRLDYLMYARHEGPGVACKVPVSQESSEDLYCMLDVLEGDLLFQDITLEYNVPENMCDYLEFKLPWHYNQKVDQGPHTIISFTDDDGTIYSEYGSVLNDCEEGIFMCPDGNAPTPIPDSSIFGCPGEDIPVCLYCGEDGDSPCTITDNISDVTRPICSDGELTCESKEAKCKPDEGESTSADCAGPGTPSCSASNEFYCGTGKSPQPSGTSGDDIRFACEALSVDLEDTGLKNCCFGEYTEINYDKEGKRTEREGEWGTDFGACIGGMARVNPIGDRGQTVIVGPIKLENVPYPKVYGDSEDIRENGLDGTYRMEKIYTYVPVGDYQPGKGLYSGYIGYKSAGSASCWGDEDGPEGCETEDRNWPDAMYENNGDLLIPNFSSGGYVDDLKGHPFFTWACLNRADEVMHRIHLIVREWNTEDEFNAYRESSGSRGTANENDGQDGCNAYESDDWISYESECNDLPDVDDVESGKAGLYTIDHNGKTVVVEELEGYPAIRYK